MRFSIQVLRATLVFVLCVVVEMPCEGDLINVALNKPTETSAVYSTFNGSFAVDGNYQTQWAAPSHASATNPHWLVVDLGSNYSIEKIVLTGPSSTFVGYTQNYNLYRGLTSTNWELVGSGILIDTSDPQDTWQISGGAMRYVKFEQVGGTHWAQLYELEVFAVPEPTSLVLLVFAGSLGGLVTRYHSIRKRNERKMQELGQ